MSDAESPLLATCVVGAGPAGLLFSLVAGIRREQLELTDVWPIVLVDKRTSYERTHRLRIDSEPYLAAQATLNHALLDELIEFLDAQRFRPAANELEAVLLSLVSQLGIRKLRATVGPDQGELDLRQLRRALQARGTIARHTRLSIVAADSVSSRTRGLVAGAVPAVEQVHQTVARLRIDADNLPEKLDRVRQFKLAKLLGSALDYRANPNGFAEVDLFLSPAEHEAVVALGARPVSPVPLTPEVLASLRAPLFGGVAQYLKWNLGPSECAVSVYSTFVLEHRYSEQVTFEVPAIGAQVFLVGDAAVSLPFFRGMACLMKCVNELAAVHAELAPTAITAGSFAQSAQRYDTKVRAIRQAEVRTVETRARAVSVAREVTRVSSISPFPIQTWLLSIRPFLQPAGRLTKQLAVTIVLAGLAAVLAIASPQLGLAGLLSIPLQAASGFLYRAGLDDPIGPNRWISRICRLQMVALILAGALVAVVNPFESGIWIRLGAAVGWFILGLVFIAGMYAAESAGTSRAARAA